MFLFILKVVDRASGSGFLVRAESDEKARKLARDLAKREGRDDREAYLDPSRVSCTILLADGTPGVVHEFL
jgi:hypothetical protein